MKRLIRFHHSFGNNATEFSDCSTEFEVLPVVVEDAAGAQELKAAAKKLGIKTKGTVKTNDNERPWQVRITHAISTGTKVTLRGGGEVEEFLGFIKLPESSLSVVIEAGGRLTEEQCREIINCQQHGVQDVGDHVDGKNILVKSGWEFYTELRLLGYHHDQFLEVLEVEDYGFYDDTSSCSGCCTYDDNDNGYVSNFREVNGEYLGVNCGCYKKALEDFSTIEDEFVNNEGKAIERELAQQHEKDGNIFLIEQFIGGWTDRGRGGFFAGKSVRNGQPEAVAKVLKNLKVDFVFSHDESGQFQTYWSAYAVNPCGKKITPKKLEQIRKKLASTPLE